MTDDTQTAALAALRRQVAALEQQLAEAEMSRAAVRAADLAAQARIALDQCLVDEALMLALAAARAAASLPQPPLAVAQIVRQALEQIPPQRSLTDMSPANMSCAWHPDSRRLTVSTGDSSTTPSQITLWDVATGQTHRRLEGDVVSPASRQAIDAAGRDPNLRGVDPRHYLWNIELLRWSPDGRTLLIVRRDGVALLWDPDAEAPHRGLPAPAPVTVSRPADREQDEPPIPEEGETRTVSLMLAWKITALAWSDDGARLLMVYEAGDRRCWQTEAFAARLWDAATGALLAELAPTELEIVCMAASPDAQAIAVGDREGRIRILEAATGALRRELMSPSGWVSILAWSPDSTCLVSSDSPYPHVHDLAARTQIWDTRSGALIGEITGVIPAQPWSPDGQSVVTIEGEAALWIWDSATGDRREALGWERHRQLFWSPDGQFMLVTNRAGMALWELSNKHMHQLVELPGGLIDVAWSPDRRWLAGTTGDTVRVYDLLRWQPARPLPASRPPIFKQIPPARLLGADWTAAGPRLVARSEPGEPPQLQAWDLAGPLGPPLALNGEAADYIDARWHPQGRTVLLRAEADRQRTPWFMRLLHWEVATGATRELRSDGPLIDMRWSPDGDRYALLAADGGVQIRAAATDALLERLPSVGHGEFQICWSLDGSALLQLQFGKSRERPEDGEQCLRVLATVHGAQTLRWELRLEHRWRFHGAGWGPGGPQLLVEHPVPNVDQEWQENIHRGLTMWDLGQGAVQWQTNNPILSSSQATWSPDGRKILLNSAFRQAVIDAATGAVLEIFERNVIGGMEWDLEGTPTERWRPDSREFFSFPLGAEWEPTRRCRFIVAPDLLEAELTRRVCERLGDSMGEANLDAHLHALIPNWRGARAELANLADTLAEYDRICAEGNGYRP